MGYQFIKLTLISHFPEVDEFGTLTCACGWEVSDDLAEMIDQWAEHVEDWWNHSG